ADWRKRRLVLAEGQRHVGVLECENTEHQEEQAVPQRKFPDGVKQRDHQRDGDCSSWVLICERDGQNRRGGDQQCDNGEENEGFGGGPFVQRARSLRRDALPKRKLAHDHGNSARTGSLSCRSTCQRSTIPPERMSIASAVKSESSSAATVPVKRIRNTFGLMGLVGKSGGRTTVYRYLKATRAASSSLFAESIRSSREVYLA